MAESVLQEDFSNVDYYMLTNLICFYATKQYFKTYDAVLMPYDFVDFYFEEVKLYDSFHTDHLKKFFIKFKYKKNNVADATDIFLKSFDNIAEPKTILKKKMFSKLKPGDYISISRDGINTVLTYNTQNKDLDGAFAALKNIANKISNPDSKTTIQAKYNAYKLKKVLDEQAKKIDAETQNKNNKKFKSNKKEEHNTSKISKITSAEMLKAKDDFSDYSLNKSKMYDDDDDDEEQNSAVVYSGPAYVKKDTSTDNKKVTRIYIPKLPLPTSYPKSATKSRINSNVLPYHFFSGAQLYSILENLNIVKISYNEDFIEKRTELFKEKSKKFSDFF